MPRAAQDQSQDTDELLGYICSMVVPTLTAQLVSAIAANFHVDNIVLVGIPLPSITNVFIDSSKRLNKVDARHFGVNTVASDGLVANSGSQLQESGFTSLRFPGGMIADDVITTRSCDCDFGMIFKTVVYHTN